MKAFLSFIILTVSLSISIPSYAAQTVKIDVGGMMCEYCVNKLKQSFKKIKSIRKADVYYKDKRRGDGAYIYLHGDMNKPLEAKLKKAVAAHGFYIKKFSIIQ